MNRYLKGKGSLLTHPYSVHLTNVEVNWYLHSFIPFGNVSTIFFLPYKDTQRKERIKDRQIIMVYVFL